MKKEGKDWPTFLSVSNYHIDFPFSPPTHRDSKNKVATPPIDSSAPSSKIPHPIAPSSPSSEITPGPVLSAHSLEVAQPSGSFVPSPSKSLQPSKNPISSKPSLAQVHRRNKRKEKAQETVIEEQAEPLVELPLMEIEDNPPIIQSTVDTPVLTISSRRKFVLS